MNRRRLAYRLYPRPIAVLDLLNKNPAFERFVAVTFETTHQVRDRFAMFEAVNREVTGPIDFLELGSGRARQLGFGLRSIPIPRAVFLALIVLKDCPKPGQTPPSGAFSTQGQTPCLHDHRVRFVKGLFQSSLRPFLKTFTPRNRFIIHIDSDLYSSSLFALTTLDEFLIPNSIVMFDEFYDLRNEFDAWCDYSRAFYRKASGLAFTPDYAQVALKIL